MEKRRPIFFQRNISGSNIISRTVCIYKAILIFKRNSLPVCRAQFNKFNHSTFAFIWPFYASLYWFDIEWLLWQIFQQRKWWNDRFFMWQICYKWHRHKPQIILQIRWIQFSFFCTSLNAIATRVQFFWWISNQYEYICFYIAIDAMMFIGT